MVVDIKEGGRLETGFFWMLIHNGERKPRKPFARSAPGTWGFLQGPIGTDPNHDVWSGSATMPISEATPLLPGTLTLFCGAIICCFK